MLYAYTLMSNQRVLIVSVLVGMTLPDGRYAYFSEKFSFETEESVTTTSADQETALTDAQARLPCGRIFRLLAYGMTTRQGLDWDKCPSVSFYPPEICPVGTLVEQLFPNQAKTFVLRLADEFSPNWLLAGWVFARTKFARNLTPKNWCPAPALMFPCRNHPNHRSVPL